MSKQEQIAKAAIYITRCMEIYSELGYEDYPVVGRKLTDAMKIISDHLTPDNQVKFADYLIKKTEQLKEKEVQIINERIH